MARSWFGLIIVAASTLLGLTVASGTPAQAATQTSCGSKEVSRVAAPGERESETFAVDSVGTVRVYETQAQTLEVQSVTTGSGWSATDVTASGNPVRVLFRNSRGQKRHFTARLNSNGTRLTTVVVPCAG
jgi:hypothetical protein